MSEESPKISRREQRAARRREAILEAAAQVFTDKGYNGASIRDIADAANVADGTIYNYFANKEALLLALFDRLIDVEQTEAQLDAALSDDLSQMLPNYFGTHLTTVRQHYALFRAVIPEVLATPDLRERYYQSFVAPLLDTAAAHIEQRISQGELAAMEPQHAARVIYALFFGLLCLRILGDPVIQPSQTTDASLLDTITQLLAIGHDE